MGFQSLQNYNHTIEVRKHQNHGGNLARYHMRIPNSLGRDETYVSVSPAITIHCKILAFFFNSKIEIVGTWNSLTLLIREAARLNSFKALVKTFFMD